MRDILVLDLGFEFRDDAEQGLTVHVHLRDNNARPIQFTGVRRSISRTDGVWEITHRVYTSSGPVTRVASIPVEDVSYIEYDDPAATAFDNENGHSQDVVIVNDPELTS